MSATVEATSTPVPVVAVAKKRRKLTRTAKAIGRYRADVPGKDSQQTRPANVHLSKRMAGHMLSDRLHRLERLLHRFDDHDRLVAEAEQSLGDLTAGIAEFGGKIDRGQDTPQVCFDVFDARAVLPALKKLKLLDSSRRNPAIEELEATQLLTQLLCERERALAKLRRRKPADTRVETVKSQLESLYGLISGRLGARIERNDGVPLVVFDSYRPEVVARTLSLLSHLDQRRPDAVRPGANGRFLGYETPRTHGRCDPWCKPGCTEKHSDDAPVAEVDELLLEDVRRYEAIAPLFDVPDVDELEALLKRYEADAYVPDDGDWYYDYLGGELDDEVEAGEETPYHDPREPELGVSHAG